MSFIRKDPRRPTVDIVADLEADSLARRAVADTGELADLSALIAEAEHAQTEVEQLKELLSEASARLQRYQGDLLPSALDAAGVQSFRTRDGLQVSVAPHYACTLSRQRNEDERAHDGRKALALEYLRRSGNAGLIKNELTVTIPKGGDDIAHELVDLADSHRLAWTLEETVHPSTLLAFLREHVEGAADTDRSAILETLEALFRLSVFRRASIKPARG